MDMLGRTSAGSCGPRGLHTDGAGTTAATSTGPQGRGTGRGLDPDSLSCELGRWPPSFSVTPAPTLTWQTRPSRTVKTASRGPRGRGLIRGERVDGRWDTRRHGRPHGRGKLWLEPTPSPETRAHVGLRGLRPEAGTFPQERPEDSPTGQKATASEGHQCPRRAQHGGRTAAWPGPRGPRAQNLRQGQRRDRTRVTRQPRDRSHRPSRPAKRNPKTAKTKTRNSRKQNGRDGPLGL